MFVLGDFLNYLYQFADYMFIGGSWIASYVWWQELLNLVERLKSGSGNISIQELDRITRIARTLAFLYPTRQIMSEIHYVQR